MLFEKNIDTMLFRRQGNGDYRSIARETVVVGLSPYHATDPKVFAPALGIAHGIHKLYIPLSEIEDLLESYHGDSDIPRLEK